MNKMKKVDVENNMKWEKIILDGMPHYRLKVRKGFHIDVEPYGDKCIIWTCPEGWYTDFLKINNIEDALQIAEDLAKVILKHADKIFH